MKSYNKILLSVLSLLLIFSFPILITMQNNSSPADIRFDIDLDFSPPLYAQQHETWAGVRFIANAARLINANIDAFMTALNNRVEISDSITGEWTGEYTHSVTGNSFTYKLGLNQEYTATNSVDGTEDTYSHGYMLCEDGSPVYQIFFDSAEEPGSGDGTLLIYKPERFATFFDHANAPGVVAEFTLTGSPGSRTEIMSWTGGPLFDGGTVTDARVIITESDSGAQINFSGAAKLNTPDLCGGSDDYYALAFIADSSSPHYSTAKWGLSDGIPVSDNICTNANPTTYGTFNSTDEDGMVQEGVPADEIPSEYPAAADVDALFSDISISLNISTTILSNLSSDINFSNSIDCQ